MSLVQSYLFECVNFHTPLQWRLLVRIRELIHIASLLNNEFVAVQ